jgi:hypothetical protein
MEHFFIEDEFYGDLQDYIDSLIDGEDSVKELPDDWKIEVATTKLEKAFKVGKEDAADDLSEVWCDRHDDRGGETYKDDVREALLKVIDVDKINEAIPSYYFPDGNVATITKQDLLDWIN